jgi:hypothetical protein
MMTTEEINRSVKQNRNWVLVGVAVGVALIAGYFGYEFAMRPDRPAIATAPQAQIVDYIINPRGMETLANIEQQQFLDDWRERLLKSAEDKEALKAALTNLPSESRKRFIDTMLRQFKQIVVNDAEQFDQLGTAERNKFIFKQATEFEAQEAFVTDLAKIFGKEGMSQDDLREWIFKETSPREREICIPYVEAMNRVIEQRRKERRAEATTQPT